MALTYAEQNEWIEKEGFLDRVQQASVAQAIIVMGESASGVPGHDERAIWAQTVLSQNVATTIGRGVLTSSNCGTGVDDPLDDDDALLYTIALQWNAYSGYSAVA